MPLFTLTPELTAEADGWSDAVIAGVERGVRSAAEVVREHAERSLTTRVDPWGAPFAPLSETTLRLYADLVEVSPQPLAQSVGIRSVSTHKVRVGITGRARRYAYQNQFGAERNQMFNNDGYAPIPARPFLPLRDNDTVDMPQAMRDAVVAALRDGIKQAIQRARARRVAEGIRDTRRASSTLRALGPPPASLFAG